MSRRLIGAPIILGGFLLFGANPSTGKDKPPLSEEAAIARRHLVEQSVKVDPAKASKFWLLYDKYQKELDIFRNARLEILSSFGENYDNMSESDADKIIDERIKIERQRMELLERTTKEMAQVLSKRELVRFLQVELKIKAFIDAGIEEEIPILQ